MLLPQGNSSTWVLNIISHLFLDFISASVPSLFCVVNISLLTTSVTYKWVILFPILKKKILSSNPHSLCHDFISLLHITAKLLKNSWVLLFPIVFSLFLPSSFQGYFHTHNSTWSTFCQFHQWLFWYQLQWTIFYPYLTLLWAGFHIINL